MTSPLMQINNLHITLTQHKHTQPLVNDISFSIYPKEIVGLIGESGCGKSLTASALLGLLPSYCKVTGSILFEGQDLLKHNPQAWQKLRGTRLSLILQDPASALNPLLTIGTQLIESLCYHKKMSKEEAFNKSLQWLHRVGIHESSERMRQYPHEISGGMKQRILIAMALICQPSLLIADEPTTALDVTIQLQILDLLNKLQEEENMSILLITHDLGVVAKCCQRVMVMYAGQIVESGPIKQIFQIPQHPYTKSLLDSRQSLEKRGTNLFYLDGSPPLLKEKSIGCPFVPRCPYAMQICQHTLPPIEQTKDNHVRCWLPKSSQEA